MRFIREGERAFLTIVFDSRYDMVVDADVIESIELDEDDGQPTLYEEYQDLYGGDDYDEQWIIEEWDRHYGFSVYRYRIYGRRCVDVVTYQ